LEKPVANHKDAAKRARQSLVRRLRNRAYRTMMRNRIKAVREAIASNNLEAAKTSFNAAMSTIHRIAGKGIIHRNQAARRISRLNAAVKKLALGGKA
jgi:small subunit ribosomal protein S20